MNSHQVNRLTDYAHAYREAIEDGLSVQQITDLRETAWFDLRAMGLRHASAELREIEALITEQQ